MAECELHLKLHNGPLDLLLYCRPPYHVPVGILPVPRGVHSSVRTGKPAGRVTGIAGLEAEGAAETKNPGSSWWEELG